MRGLSGRGSCICVILRITVSVPDVRTFVVPFVGLAEKAVRLKAREFFRYVWIGMPSPISGTEKLREREVGGSASSSLISMGSDANDAAECEGGNDEFVCNMEARFLLAFGTLPVLGCPERFSTTCLLAPL